GVALAQYALYVQVLDGGVGRLLRVRFGGSGIGTPERVPLPFDGAVWVAAADRRLSGIFLGLTSWTKASRILVYDVASHRVSDTGLQRRGQFDDPRAVEIEEDRVTRY